MAADPVDAPSIIDGQEGRSGEDFTQRAPHDHDLSLAELHAPSAADTQRAIGGVVEAGREWSTWSFADRAAVTQATAALRDTAGNLYVNDKPTRSIVGWQPFGGRTTVGDQRQGRVDPEPATLRVTARDQGDLGRPAGLAVPARAVSNDQR
jgi:delta 1-pyrroline-5-carboxylate dehydrogenase